jgi:hypothetical protein
MLWVNNTGTGGLTYATRAGSDWAASDIPGSQSMEQPLLIVRPDGELVVGFAGFDGPSVARKLLGRPWSVETLADELGLNARIAMTSAGQIHMVDQRLGDRVLYHYTNCP